jgi:hypothetical protein
MSTDTAKRTYENSGNLSRVPDRKSDKHPEFEGEFSITCPHCSGTASGWVKAWVKEKAGSKFFSLAFKMKQKRSDQ